MKTLLSAGAAWLFAGTMASAQGITLFGDAYIGLGYNIDNEGGVLTELQSDGETEELTDDLRAVSRVRFGVVMVGETESGITFGAEIRADNAQGGEGGEDGQTEGSVFVSGAWGTLSFGDVDGADENWVGDVPGNFSLTGLTDTNETLFISNGGDFGNDTGGTFAENPFARPTVRYDFDFENFGFSLSTNRDLTDIGVGAGYEADFAGGTWSVGAGYYKFDSFTDFGEPVETIDPDTGEVIIDVPTTFIPNGEQWSVGLNAEYERFAFGVTYMDVSSDTDALGRVRADNLLVGVSATFDAFSVGAFYGKVLSAEGSEEFEVSDGDDGYGLTAQYDLGGGATINGGIVNSYAVTDLDDNGSATIADFGIAMEF
jgi:outer membrane protein OmpU